MANGTDDNSTDGGRVTVAQLYKAINELSERIDNRFSTLEDTMRQSYASRDVCNERHQAYMAALEASDKASKDDRDKLWLAVHGVESQLKWGAGVVITAFVGVIVWLIQNH